MADTKQARRASGLARCLAALAVALLAANLVALLGARHWVAELLTHFVPHYAGASGLLACALGALRRWRWSALCLALLAWNGWQVWRALPPPVTTAPAGETGAGLGEPVGRRVRVLLWNVDMANPGAERALGWILEQELALDAIVLLEVGPAWRRVVDSLGRFYPHREVRLRDDRFGIAVFSRLPGSSLRLLARRSGFPSVVLTAATADGAPLALWALHLPPPVSRALANERNAQLVSLARATRDPPLPMVVLGDLNVTPWSPWFRRLLEAGGLADLAGGPHWPTWAPAPVPAALGLALDHVLATPGIRLLSRRLGPRLGSDHRPVVVHLEVLPVTPR